MATVVQKDGCICANSLLQLCGQVAVVVQTGGWRCADRRLQLYIQVAVLVQTATVVQTIQGDYFEGMS